MQQRLSAHAYGASVPQTSLQNARDLSVQVGQRRDVCRQPVGQDGKGLELVVLHLE